VTVTELVKSFATGEAPAEGAVDEREVDRGLLVKALQEAPEPAGLKAEDAETASSRLPKTVSALTRRLLPRYTCVTKIALSDGIEITKSKILRNVQVGEKLEGLGAETEDKQTNVVRVHVRVGEQTGWVTLKGNQGTVFLQLDKDP